MQALSDVIPVILAAGDSVRMGYPKALLPLENDDTTGLGKPVVVLGRAASRIQNALDLRDAEVLVNEDPDRGQLSSVQLALQSLRPDIVGAMIWPVDQPLIANRLVEDLARLFLSTGAPVANPVCGSKRGHPVIFHREVFAELMAASVDEGPKAIVNRYEQDSADLLTDETGTIIDIDTPSDYENVCGKNLESAIKG
ncbi:MAG: nucleotidyltransferase family protein [Acidobacteriota bacterium]